MLFSEVCKQVVQTKGACRIRARRTQLDGQAWQYDCAEVFGGKKKGWTIVDLFTASAVVGVYDKLSAENREKFDKMPLMTAVNVTWGCYKRA